jgi:hypothetical protein
MHNESKIFQFLLKIPHIRKLWGVSIKLFLSNHFKGEKKRRRRRQKSYQKSEFLVTCFQDCYQMRPIFS